MGSGPLPPRLKERALANVANTGPPHVVTTPVNVPAINASNVGAPIVQPPPIATSDMDTSRAVGPSGPTESNVTSPVDRSSEPATSITDDSIPDGESYASTLPDVFDFDVDWDGLEIATAAPWVTMDRLTGEIIVGDDSALAVPTFGQAVTEEVELLPRLDTRTLTESEPPALLFEDADIRPNWLLSAVGGFLRYTPYYGSLGKVIDQFLLQEARLGYMSNVRYLHFSSRY